MPILVWFCTNLEMAETLCEHSSREDAEQCPEGDAAESYYYDGLDWVGWGDAFGKASTE